MVRPARVELATFWFVVRASECTLCVLRWVKFFCAVEIMVIGLRWANFVQSKLVFAMRKRRSAGLSPAS
jgi:hypothetical protein